MTSTRAGGVEHARRPAPESARRDPLVRRVRESTRSIRQRLVTRRISSGCRAPRSSRLPSAEIIGSTPPTICENRARAWIDVELGRDVDRALEIVGPAAERVGQRQQDAADLLGLLLLERDDVVVDLDRLERLEEQAGAAGRGAVHDAGNRRAVLGAHHQHVAAVAVGDDLLLQVLRRVAAAQERRRAWSAASRAAGAAARGCCAAPGWRCRRPRRRIDLAPDVGDLAPERRDRLDERTQDGKRRLEPGDGAARLLDRLEIVGEAEQPQRLERAAFDAERVEDLVEVRRRAQRESRDGRRGTACPRSLPLCAPHRRDVGHRMQLASRSRPVGVTAGRRRRDDAIEFEGPQAPACMDETRSAGSDGINAASLQIGLGLRASVSGLACYSDRRPSDRVVQVIDRAGHARRRRSRCRCSPPRRRSRSC